MAWNLFSRTTTVVEVNDDPFAAATTTPDAAPTAYRGTATPAEDDGLAEWEQELLAAVFDDDQDLGPQLSVTVIDGGLHAGTFEYDSINEFADAVRNFGSLYGDDDTVTLVITRR